MSANFALTAIVFCVTDLGSPRTSYPSTMRKQNPGHQDAPTTCENQHQRNICWRMLITPADHVKTLGSWFDSNLSMSSYVTKIASTCSYFIHNIRRFRKDLSMNTSVNLVNTMVTAHLGYFNSLLYSHPSNILARLHRPKHCGQARLPIITFLSFFPLLYDLHWLPLQYRV